MSATHTCWYRIYEDGSRKKVVGYEARRYGVPVAVMRMKVDEQVGGLRVVRTGWAVKVVQTTLNVTAKSLRGAKEIAEACAWNVDTNSMPV